MRVLVTGGAGFIGSHLTERLLADGHAVRVLDDLSTGKSSNLDGCPGVEFIAGDVGDPNVVRGAVEGCQLVFHEAAIASVPRTLEDPLGSLRVNYQGTVNVLDSSLRKGVKRVVFAASSAVYGNSIDQPSREQQSVHPLSPYAVDKLASEFACQVYSAVHGLETVSLRYFNVYGPRQDPGSPYSGVISLFARALVDRRAPTILGDGGQTRDFVYVDDVVEANMRAASAESVVGKVINVGTGRAISVRKLFILLREIEGIEIDARHAPGRIGEVRDSLAYVARARELLGWQPTVSLEEGLNRLLGALKAGKRG